ncbi:MAG: phosphoribosylanthranilate isomerase [Candidatus Omnitrophota bacterium]|nr:phosphoribosylanthranilate isomerase [Candidatus Omnitrophota bacterium]
MVKVKICGITNIDDALATVEAGADALGFVLYKESPRYISPTRAREIIAQLPRNILKVGVFVNAKEKEIRHADALCVFGLLQFHGDETPEFCAGFGEKKVIKAVRVQRKRDIRQALRYNTYGLLFDAYTRAKYGGSGEKFDWELVRDFPREGRVIFLSGGLNAENVGQAIAVVGPDWVDASSSLESSRGIKDTEKVKAFIAAAKVSD